MKNEISNNPLKLPVSLDRLGIRLTLSLISSLSICCTNFAPKVDAASAYQETEATGLSARLDYAQQYEGVLHIAVRLKNNSENTLTLPKTISYSNLILLDAAGGKKYFPLKNAYDHYLAGPISDWNGGGRWFVKIPPKTEAVFWAFFNAPPPGASLSLEAPGMFPFDKISIDPKALPNKTADAGLVAPMKLTFVSANREAGRLNVRLKVNNPGPYKLNSTAIAWADAYALDAGGGRQYPVLKDAEGNFAAQPRSDKNEGGRWWVTELNPGQNGLLSIVFQAPPDSVSNTDIVIPHFAPLLAVPIAGKGGAPAGGIAVVGKTLGLEQALKDLNAEVGKEEIKVKFAADVLFDFDKAEIKKQAEPALAKLIVVLKNYPKAELSVEGHTDGKGGDDYNQELSEKRASSVALWLMSRSGISKQQVKTAGFGSKKPVAANNKEDGSDNPEGRAKNRRVEIILKK